MTVKSHYDLIVWQKSIQLVEIVYSLSARFPRSEIYRLTDQITRAAISVPANIAEGHERSTARDYAQFLSIAKGSLMEVDTYLILSARLGYLTANDVREARLLIVEINKMLGSLRRRLLVRQTPRRTSTARNAPSPTPNT